MSDKPVLGSQADVVFINHASHLYDHFMWDELQSVSIWLREYALNRLMPARPQDTLCLTRPILVAVCITEKFILFKLFLLKLFSCGIQQFNQCSLQEDIRTWKVHQVLVESKIDHCQLQWKNRRLTKHLSKSLKPSLHALVLFYELWNWLFLGRFKWPGDRKVIKDK